MHPLWPGCSCEGHLRQGVLGQLEAGHDVAYSALSTQEGFAAERIAGGDDITLSDQSISLYIFR